MGIWKIELPVSECPQVGACLFYLGTGRNHGGWVRRKERKILGR
jgi:hypothetical protein